MVRSVIRLYLAVAPAVCVPRPSNKLASAAAHPCTAMMTDNVQQARDSSMRAGCNTAAVDAPAVVPARGVPAGRLAARAIACKLIIGKALQQRRKVSLKAAHPVTATLAASDMPEECTCTVWEGLGQNF